MPFDLFPIGRFCSLPSNSIAITVSKPNEGRFLHCMIAFNHQNTVNFLHLAFHQSLRLDKLQDILKYNKGCIYINFSKFIKTDPHFFLRKSLIAYMYAVFEKNRNTIPYSFLFKNSTFNLNGNLIFGENEYGLTCATFVMAIFESHGIFLCDKDSWPIREEDKIFHKEIISFYSQNSKIPKSHIELMKTEVGCVRFRPEEVLCSSNKVPLPCKFDEIEECSKIILHSLNSN